MATRLGVLGLNGKWEKGEGLAVLKGGKGFDACVGTRLAWSDALGGEWRQWAVASAGRRRVSPEGRGDATGRRRVRRAASYEMGRG